MRSDNNKTRKVGKRASTVNKNNVNNVQDEKIEKKKGKKETVFRLFLILILLIVIVCIGLYITRLNTDYIENYNFYQYIAGRKISYEGALKITAKGEITELTCQNTNVQLDSTPLYYTDEPNRVLFPENMELVLPNQNGQIYKINRFSDVNMNQNVLYLEYRDKVRELPDGFIFDGSNLYFFLSNATLTIDDKEYELTPLSYVVAYNQSSIEIYNKEKDEYQIIETKDQGIVETKGYSINVSLDTIKYGEKEQLLLRKFDQLETFELN